MFVSHTDMHMHKNKLTKQNNNNKITNHNNKTKSTFVPPPFRQRQFIRV